MKHDNDMVFVFSKVPQSVRCGPVRRSTAEVLVQTLLVVGSQDIEIRDSWVDGKEHLQITGRLSEWRELVEAIPDERSDRLSQLVFEIRCGIEDGERCLSGDCPDCAEEAA